MVIPIIIASMIEIAIIMCTLNKIFNIQVTVKNILCFLTCTIEVCLIRCFTSLDSFYILIPIITYSIYSMIELKRIKFISFIFPVVLSMLLLLSSDIACFCAEELSQLPETHFSANEFMYTRYIISLHFFLIFCFFVYFIVYHKKENFDLNKWWLQAITIFILFAMFSNLLQSVIYTSSNIYTVYSLIIELSILSICIITLYFRLKKQTKMSLEMSQQIAKMQYQNQMYSIVDKVKDQLMNEKHTMLYNLMNMKLLLTTNNKKELKKYIDEEIDKMMKYKYISSTGNALFDYTFTNKLNHLMYKNVDVKTVFMLSKNNLLLEDETVVDFMINCIDHLVSLNVKNIEIFLQEHNKTYLLFKLIVYSKNSLELTSDDFMYERIKKISLKNEVFYYEISMLLG